MSSPTIIPQRLTVKQFAFCIQRSDEVVRRYIRSNKYGVRAFAHGNPIQIDPAAFAKFKVSLEMASLRLTLLQASQQTAA